MIKARTREKNAIHEGYYIAVKEVRLNIACFGVFLIGRISALVSTKKARLPKPGCFFIVLGGLLVLYP